MHFSSCLLVLIIALAVKARVLKTPLSATRISPETSRALNLKRGVQKPMNDDVNQDKSGGTPVTLNLTHELGYFVSVAVGNPRQQFSLFLEISAPDSFIASSEYISDSYFTGYNASQSQTYVPAGDSLPINYFFMSSTGNISSDSFYFDGLEIPNQRFQEATKVEIFGVSWDDTSLIQGVLGLTPTSKGSVANMDGPFSSAVAQRLLDRNIFALRLAEPGELIIGDINKEMYKGPIRYIPVTNATSSFMLTGRWQSSATYISLGPSTDLYWSLEGYNAVYSTLLPSIYLPDRIAWDLNKLLGFEELMFMPQSIDCRLRSSLPIVTLNLGGRDFILTAYEYTYEWPMSEGHVRCVSVFGYSGIVEKEIIIGSGFLRNFYSVFDADDMRIGFAELA